MISRARLLPLVLTLPAFVVPGFVTAAPAEALVPAPTAAIDPDPSSRASMKQGYLEILKPAMQTPMGWTGNIAGCDAGAPSAAAQAATLTAVNYFRDLVGVGPVTFDSALSAKAQQAALMMAANDQLSHDPPPEWACYTADGDAAAGKSNLYLGVTGARSIAGYMDDPGAGNTFVGHRRWIMDPRQTKMGSGSVHVHGGAWHDSSNALYVLDSPSFQPTPAATPEFLPWPVAGYVPLQIEPEGRWSLSAKGPVNFSGATVQVNGSSAGVTVQPVVNNYGPNTLVWEFDPDFDLGDADRTYHVVVSGISGASTTSYAYDVTLFDAEEVTKSAQTISFTDPADRTYGAASGALAATATSGLPVTFTTQTPQVCSTSGAQGQTVVVESAGTCTIAANQSGNATYEAAPEVQQSFSIAKKQLVVSAVDAERAVGEPNPAFGVSWSGFAYGETLASSGVTGAPSCSSTATSDSPAGTYPITCENGSLASANYSFTFESGTLTVSDGDTTPPTIEGVGKLFRVALYDFSMSWTVSDPESGVDEIRQWVFTRTPSTGWTSSTTDWEAPATSDWPSQPEGQTTCLRGQARNGVGDVSGWTDAYCIHTPLDDTGLTASSAWKSVTDTGLWFGSALTTRKTGARLTLPGVQDAGRFGVVATRCPSCGKVGVYVGTTKVGVLRLAADELETQDVMVLPRRAALLDGKLRLVVESTDKKVQIDGVVVSGPPLA